VVFGVGVVLAVVLAYDLLQRSHALLRNFPLIGHLRYLLEAVGPELRQYIVTDNDEERPFSRDQRRWVYSSAKRVDNHFGFGTDNDLERTDNYLIIKQAAFPLATPAPGDDRVPGPKVLGGARHRRLAFRPRSAVNVSAMSFGALSGAAIEALNRGCALAGALHNTGEGGLSPHHCHGGELTYQIGTGYFGCRDRDGNFDLPRLVDLVAAHPVRAIEIKLSQGAKPGIGGVLPGAKVTPEVAAIRGIEAGRTCISPAAHRAFQDVDGLLDFVERLAEATGLPVGIKSAVGEERFWEDLARLMAAGGRGVDFITIDGGEGGTGAAPLAFSDHVSLPYKLGMARALRPFAEAGIAADITWIGSAKLGFPEQAVGAFALGADLVNVGREAMLAIGCIQAQRCHTGRCPVGVATQSRRLTRGLDPGLKSVRVANYLSTLREELLQLAHACGVPHPALIDASQVEVLQDRYRSSTLAEVFGYQPGWGLPRPADVALLAELLGPLAV